MKNLMLFGSIILLLSSCQKVIDVDLNSANPQVVIEANVYEGTHEVRVRVTKTSSYFNSNAAIPVVNNATVTLTDNIQPAVTLTAIGDGWYSFPNYTASINMNYKLSVTVDGQSFIANAYLPVSPILDSVSYKIFKSIFSGKERYLMTAHFQDSLGVDNFYRLIVTKNDSLQNEASDLYFFDDKIRDGQYIEVPIFSTFCDLGDTLDVEMLSMDKNVYDYFETLNESLSGDANNSAAPANPNTNFSNGALGYFGAFSSRKKSLRIQ